VFWPYHCVDEEETKSLVKTASKSDFGTVLTRRHAPARWLPTRTDSHHASHASSSPGWADPTRIPDDPTHVPDPDEYDVIMTSWHAMSATSHLTHQHSGTHLPRHQPRAELSRAKPRADGEDSVQRSLRATGSEIESGPLIKPELFWSNLNRLKCDLDDFRLVSS